MTSNFFPLLSGLDLQDRRAIRTQVELRFNTPKDVAPGWNFWDFVASDTKGQVGTTSPPSLIGTATLLYNLRS